MSEIAALHYRTAAFDVEGRAASGNDEGIPVVISTDAPVEVPIGREAVPEILMHTREAVDLARAPLPIIVTHAAGQVNVGIIDNIILVDGQMRGMARFGSRAEAAGYRADVMNRIIRSVSVGYQRVKTAMRNDGVLVTSRWMPTHTALVAEPADIGAGFYRALAELPPLEISGDQPLSNPAAPAASIGAIMAENQAAAGAIAEVQQPAGERAAAQPAQQVAIQNSGERAVEMERNRRRGIENLAKANKIDDGIRDYWIGTGLSVEAITDDLLKIIEERGRKNPQSDAKLGLSAQEVQRYSMFNAIRAVVDKNWSNAGFELECSRAIGAKMQKLPDPNKFYVPFEVQGRNLGRNLGGNRDLTAASASGGGYLVGTENMSFIELMRNRSVAYSMGARRLSGLVGSVTVPKQTAAGTAVWLSSESATATESAQTFGQMAMTPKTVGAYTEISRQLLLQSSPDAESIVTSDLASVCALAIDVGVIRGSGTGGEPQGIVGTSGVGSVTGTSLAAAGILEFQSDVAAGNMLSGSCGYVTAPAVAALLMARPELPSTGTTRLWQGNMLDGSLFGMRAMTSNQMAAATMLFGDWSQVIVGEWGVLEVEVNPYANFQAGIIGVRALVSIDVGVRYGGAFSYASSIT